MLSFKTVDKYNKSVQKIAAMPLLHQTNYSTLLVHIQLFRERLSEKKCARQFRKVIWDMRITLFLTL